jgi:hypothetical protein
MKFISLISREPSGSWKSVLLSSSATERTRTHRG